MIENLEGEVWKNDCNDMIEMIVNNYFNSYSYL